MASFFEKLKKGMGIEIPEKEKEEVPKVKKVEVEEGRPSSPPFTDAREVEAKAPELKMKKLEIEKPEIKSEEIPVERFAETSSHLTPRPASQGSADEEKKEKWPEPEGQLAIDVYQTETELVIQSAIAGVKPEDLDISIERDILTIKGRRQKPFEESGDYFTQECYWGPFSREVILPVEVDPERTEAVMKEGILTIRIPKFLREKRRNIKVKT